MQCITVEGKLVFECFGFVAIKERERKNESFWNKRVGVTTLEFYSNNPHGFLSSGRQYL